MGGFSCHISSSSSKVYKINALLKNKQDPNVWNKKKKFWKLSGQKTKVFEGMILVVDTVSIWLIKLLLQQIVHFQ